MEQKLGDLFLNLQSLYGLLFGSIQLGLFLRFSIQNLADIFIIILFVNVNNTQSAIGSTL